MDYIYFNHPNINHLYIKVVYFHLSNKVYQLHKIHMYYFELGKILVNIYLLQLLSNLLH